jgi:hypothetical protein
MQLKSQKLRRDRPGTRYKVVAVPHSVALLWSKVDRVDVWYDEQTDTLSFRPAR